MKGTHMDDRGLYVYARYRPGDIVRRREDWGVVTTELTSSPRVTWYIDGEWLPPTSHPTADDISAPFADSYEGFPDVVLAKSIEVKLTT